MFGSWVLTDTVWVHGDGVGDVRKDTDGVASGQSVDNSVALEVKTVYVCFCAQTRQVPGNMVALAHRQARQVPVHVPIDGWNADTQIRNVVIRLNKVPSLLVWEGSSSQCILLLSMKPSSSLLTVAGAVVNVLMLSSRYQLKFSSNTVASRWNSLS